MNGILSGMHVVEGSAFVAAPLGGMTLAQLGADVIRFDPIGGGLDYRRWPVTKEGTSLFWHGMNKGKRSIQVDIRKPEGQELISSLICRSGENEGLFLTNFPARGWLSFDVLREKRGDLIYVNILGDRRGGTAVDYTVNCAVGFADATGEPGNQNPTNYLLPAWDNITGQMAAVAMLAAERHRRLTGEGQLVKLALKDVAMATAGHLGNISEVMVNDVDREKSGNYLYGGFGRDFVSKDGKRFMLVGLTLRQWQGITRSTGITEKVEQLGFELGVDLKLEGERFKARAKLASLIEPWFAENDAQAVRISLQENGVCFGPYQTFREMVEGDDDCSADNPLFSMLDQPGVGEYLVPRSPIQFDKSSNVPALKAPILGEHTDQILAEDLGLSPQQIGSLHDQKIVAQGKL
ncbi:MAG: CoA transferase [bacterium]|nr:2-methylfumaryl-CoA isomerase [Gammaproteobacteria bacterium]HIL97154.1 2-methylfumaryl-CoA isomerase [Pseudomonadales bacterium]